MDNLDGSYQQIHPSTVLYSSNVTRKIAENRGENMYVKGNLKDWGMERKLHHPDMSSRKKLECKIKIFCKGWEGEGESIFT